MDETSRGPGLEGICWAERRNYYYLHLIRKELSLTLCGLSLQPESLRRQNMFSRMQMGKINDFDNPLHKLGSQHLNKEPQGNS